MCGKAGELRRKGKGGGPSERELERLILIIGR